MDNAKHKPTKKAKKAGKADLRPTAENLNSFPKLKKQLAEIEKQVHPIDRQCFINVILLNYVRPYLRLANNVIVTQRCHYQLPKKEKLYKTRDDMGTMMYGRGKQSRPRATERDPSLPDEDAGMCFEMGPKINKGILSSFFTVYAWTFIYVLFFTLFCCFLNFMSVYAMKEGLDQVSKQIKEYGRLQNKEEILFWFMVVWGITFFTTIIKNWTDVEQTRLVIRLVGGMHGIMFEKFYRIGVINPHEQDEGSIISYLQNDVMRLYSSMFAISQFINNVVNLLLCIFMGLYFFGKIFFVLITGLIILGWVNKVVVVGIFYNYGLYASAMDKRLNMFKNILRNIKFIKISGLENIFFERIDKRRKAELRYHILTYGFDALLDFLMSIGAAIMIIGFLFVYFVAGKGFDVSTVSVLLRVFDMLKTALFGIPAGLGILASLSVNISRLNMFLESKELDTWKIRAKPNPNSKYAVEIRNGSFYWDKKLSKEEAKALREKTLEEKKGKKKSKAKAKESNTKKENELAKAAEPGSTLRQTLLTTNTEGTNADELEGEQKRFTMDNLNFSAEKGKLTMVIGKIGSGKSSILYSILGETMVADYQNSSVHINGSVCFMRQNPWLINGTVKSNIILNKPFNQEKFDWAIKYSAMDHDLKTWDLKEDHPVGEGGAAMSGGQRARVALARCLYQEPDIYIFDDIMSALDAKIGSFISEETILKQLKGKTVILVTHGLQYLKHADHIYVMEDGSIAKQGSFEEIKDTELYTKFTQLEEWSKNVENKGKQDPKAGGSATDVENSLEHSIHVMQDMVHSRMMKENNRTSYVEKGSFSLDVSGVIGVTNNLVEEFTSEEDRSVGNISCSTLDIYVKSLGGYLMIFLFIMTSLIGNTLLMFASKFLEDWAKDFEHSPKYQNLKVYGAIWGGVAFFQAVREMLRLTLNYNMSVAIHSRMMYSVLHAKMQRFLDKVPYGQIQNRFSQDIMDIDKRAVNYLYWFIDPMTNSIVIFSTIAYTVGWQLFGFMIIWIIVIFKIERGYMNAKREYNRLKAMSSSPVIITTTDVIKGLVNIRAMELRQFFREQFLEYAGEKMKNDLLDKIFVKWFAIRCSVSQQLLIQLTAILALLYIFTEIEPANVGLFFVCLFQMGPILFQTVWIKTEWESSLITVERCEFFTKLEAESGYKTYKDDYQKFSRGGAARMKKLMDRETTKYKQLNERTNPLAKKPEKLLFEDIVKEGRVNFINMSARYLGAQENVLKNINAVIEPGEKIGIVGRSGSGKSTLIKLLWGYMRPRRGRILIDGKDITRVDVKSLRSQISVITQETALFEGTLRENLDPTGFRFSDQKLIQVLTQLDFQNQSYKNEGLDMNLDSEGTNLSQGEKQLLCFARSVLNPSKLILLDEATASIDIKTEETIQKAIEREFKKSTMIIVAHRVQTVLECDRIMVMKDGEVAAFGAPDDLMKESPFFRDIVEKMQGH